MQAGKWRALVQALGASLGLCLLLSACVVEERTFDAKLALSHNKKTNTGGSGGTGDDADAGGGVGGQGGAGGSGSNSDTVSELCKQYCTDALENCTDENAVYSSTATCQGICALLPEGNNADEANTVACRARNAGLARDAEPEFYCPAAGPGGGSKSLNCGTACEAYCLLHKEICADIDSEEVLPADECERRCQGIPDTLDFDVVVNHDNDTIQCRLVHLSSATLDQKAAEDHCWHARIVPADDSPCANPADDEPTCNDYCKLNLVSCTGDQAVYADKDECLATCNALPRGKNSDKSENTVGCRRYHSYSALADPTNHCPHSGPAGDGHCGSDNCESYCMLAEAACPDEFSQAYPAQADCLDACANLDGAEPNQGYTLEQASKGNTVQCRIGQAVKALNGGSCSGVIDGDPCTGTLSLPL